MKHISLIEIYNVIEQLNKDLFCFNSVSLTDASLLTLKTTGYHTKIICAGFEVWCKDNDEIVEISKHKREKELRGCLLRKLKEIMSLNIPSV